MLGLFTSALVDRASLCYRSGPYLSQSLGLSSPLQLLHDSADRWKSVFSRVTENVHPAVLFGTIGRSWELPLVSRLLQMSRSGVQSGPDPHLNTGDDAPPPIPTPDPKPDYPITRLLNNPALRDPVRKPRNPIVLCHGLYGFDVWGPSSYPSLQIHYWHNVRNVLRNQVGAEVIVTGVPSVGSIESRALKMHEHLSDKAKGMNLNFIAHSMGGLDCRHLITHVQPTSPVYNPISLTSVCSPHRGSPFMDWCRANIGIGDLRQAIEDSKRQPNLPYSLKAPLLSRSTTASEQAATIAARLAALPASLTTLILGMVDAPAYSDLTTSYCNDIFNPSTPARPGVRYFSVAARLEKMSIFHPLWLPKVILDETELAERKALKATGSLPDPSREWGNDGLVSVESAKYGEWLGVVDGCDHWDTRGANSFGRAWIEGRGGWSQFFGAQKSAANAAAEAAAAEKTPDSERTMNKSSQPQSDADTSRTSSPEEQEQRAREQARFAGTLEWIANKVPTQAAAAALSSLTSTFSLSDPKLDAAQRPAKPKFDLELFYIALARNLYEEGL